MGRGFVPRLEEHCCSHCGYPLVHPIPEHLLCSQCYAWSTQNWSHIEYARRVEDQRRAAEWAERRREANAKRGAPVKRP